MASGCGFRRPTSTPSPWATSSRSRPGSSTDPLPIPAGGTTVRASENSSTASTRRTEGSTYPCSSNEPLAFIHTDANFIADHNDVFNDNVAAYLAAIMAEARYKLLRRMEIRAAAVRIRVCPRNAGATTSAPASPPIRPGSRNSESSRRRPAGKGGPKDRFSGTGVVGTRSSPCPVQVDPALERAVVVPLVHRRVQKIYHLLRGPDAAIGGSLGCGLECGDHRESGECVCALD